MLTPNWSLLSHQIYFRQQDWTILTDKEDRKQLGRRVARDYFSQCSLSALAPHTFSPFLCTGFPRTVDSTVLLRSSLIQLLIMAVLPLV